MNRKVFIDVQVKLVISIDEGEEVGDFIDNMEYQFVDTTGAAEVLDSEITGYEIVDSKQKVKYSVVKIETLKTPKGE